MKSDLARIGISVSILSSPNCPGQYRRADLFFVSLGSSERDPAPFLDQALGSSIFGSPLGPGPWNDPPFRKRLDEARALQGRPRLEAYRHLDGELMRAAPFAVFGSFVWSQYFSPKVGCKVFQGEYGFVDIGALCKPS